ncbi:hypothetical protein AWR36_006940 [Microbulbifer flavimaris]|uniref:Tetratricopeptide repeat protein n=1 Tax=Microbulbifer flavimaris TaxID=1781068 RepID=A0ABX4I092_9GAMM|nr:hypothetical protein AWR36_006940 [Microbulbifer flavimaris]
MEQRAELMRLSFAEFDQDPEKGWRPFYEKRCFGAAQELLSMYIERNPGVAKKNFMLNFHAGQMCAFTGDYEAAETYFRKSYSGRVSSWSNWDAFVDANIAFINSDISDLERAKSKIEQQVTITEGAYPNFPSHLYGKKINLDVVKAFMACIGKSYSIAYHDCRI